MLRHLLPQLLMEYLIHFYEQLGDAIIVDVSQVYLSGPKSEGLQSNYRNYFRFL